jgi:hypothetical protein
VFAVSRRKSTKRRDSDCPSVYACYRFTAKLRRFKPLLDACLDRVSASLRAEMPEMGRDVAVDTSDLPAYANGQRFVSKNGPERERFSDPDASWGHRSAVSTRKGGGFYGYRLHAAVCTRTDLPLAWQVESGRANESSFAAQTCAPDKGYDISPVYEALEDQGCRPIIPLRQTTGVARGDHKPPTCQHGEVALRGKRLQAPGVEVAVPHRGVQARLAVGQGRPPSPAAPARDSALAEALSGPRRRRAGVRATQE